MQKKIGSFFSASQCTWWLKSTAVCNYPHHRRNSHTIRDHTGRDKPSKDGTWLSDPGGMQGWTDLAGELDTNGVYQPEETSLERWTKLLLCQAANVPADCDVTMRRQWRRNESDCHLKAPLHHSHAVLPEYRQSQWFELAAAADLYQPQSTHHHHLYTICRIKGVPLNEINTKNCSLSIVLMATDQKPQKSLKGDITSHCLNVNGSHQPQVLTKCYLSVVIC